MDKGIYIQHRFIGAGCTRYIDGLTHMKRMERIDTCIYYHHAI